MCDWQVCEYKTYTGSSLYSSTILYHPKENCSLKTRYSMSENLLKYSDTGMLAVVGLRLTFSILPMEPIPAQTVLHSFSKATICCSTGKHKQTQTVRLPSSKNTGSLTAKRHGMKNHSTSTPAGHQTSQGANNEWYVLPWHEGATRCYYEEMK